MDQPLRAGARSRGQTDSNTRGSGVLRGLVSGGFVGIVAAALGLSVASLMTDVPGKTPVAETPAATPLAPVPVEAQPIEPTPAPENAPSPLVPRAIEETPAEAAPPAETPAAETPVAEAPAAEPMPKTAVNSAPDAAPEATILVEPPAMVAPQVEVTQPVIEPDVATPSADTETGAQPPAAEAESSLDAPAVDTDAAVDVATEEPVLPNPAAQAPQTPGSEADLEVQTDPAVPVVEEATDDAAAPGEDQTAMVDLPVDVAPEMSAPKPPTELSGTPAGQMPSSASGVKVNRPGDAPETAAPAPMQTTVGLDQFAATFTNPNDLPLMSIILVDEGTMANADAALRNSPFPVTVALDPTLPDAKDRMMAYRAAGIEVMALAKLPQGATAMDVDVVLGASFDVLPETIALLDTGVSNLDSPAQLKQAMATLSDSGRGFVSISMGLNSAIREAELAGVPATLIYRELDAEDQNAQVIRRFLDQAAFRARQESGVVLLGRVRPDTISALILWATANRAEQVAQAPVSAVLQAIAAQSK